MRIRHVLFRLCAALALFTGLCTTLAAAPHTVPDSSSWAPGRIFRDCPDCPQMTVIPAGHFVLDAAGSPQTIAIERPFAIGKYEVTFGEWDACVAAGGCGGYRPSDEGWGRERRPVMNISWQDAELYVKWLSQKTGRHYRLPSEAEWEYAARGGLSPHHLKGDLPENNSTGCDNCVGQWANIQTSVVGRLEPNVFGLFDTQGNIWEWVADCADCECETRILRGAALGDGKTVSRASRRLRNSGSDRNGHAGLRVAMSLGPDTRTTTPLTAAPDQPGEPRTVGSLLPTACGQPAKAEPECKPVREIYRVEISERPFVLEGAFFDTDSAVLKPEGKEKLDAVTRFAEEHPAANLDVTGHTDSSGSEAWNRELSAARAASVKTYLVDNGVKAERITTKGVASTQPAATNETVEGRARNRRVEIRSAIREEQKIRVE